MSAVLAAGRLKFGGEQRPAFRQHLQTLIAPVVLCVQLTPVFFLRKMWSSSLAFKHMTLGNVKFSERLPASGCTDVLSEG